MENMTRRENLQIQGDPEQTEGQDLGQYLQDLFQEVTGDREHTPIQIQMDRYHRVSPVRPGTDSSPRDTLTKCHHFTIK